MPAPPELEATMRVLADAFRRPEPIPSSAELAERCAAIVTGNARLSPAAQADIYRRQFWLRHQTSFQDDYPGLYLLLGHDAFLAFCKAYLLAHPPSSRFMRDLDLELVTFAEGYPFPEHLRDAAIELTRYEQRLNDLFARAEPTRLDPKRLAELPDEIWESARIVLSPLLELLRLRFPVHAIHRAARAGEALSSPITEAPTTVAVFRKDNLLYCEELDPKAYALLEALSRGEPLVPACERIAEGLSTEEQETLSERVAPWFQQWSAWGWITDIVLP